MPAADERRDDEHHGESGKCRHPRVAEEIVEPERRGHAEAEVPHIAGDREQPAREKAEAVPGGAWRYQLAAAGMALAIGLALGWSAAEPRQTDQDQALYASYAVSGPAARLTGL